MNEVAGSIWWLIVSLGILVTFHEFGHYWVARRCGVKVLRFSVGFGKPLWKRIGRDGTEYVVAALPLGGYVKMLDERETDVPPEMLSQAFTRKSVFQRFAIVAAGPVFNLILCVFFLWAMFVVGKGDFEPQIGRTQGVAAEAGLRPDDRILAIDGVKMDTWTHAAMALTGIALDRATAQIEVARSGANQTVTLDLSRFILPSDETRVLSSLGLSPRQRLLPPEISSAAEGSPAAQAGFKPGDRIVAVGDTDIVWWDDIGAAIQTQARPGLPLVVQVQRGGERLALDVTPKWEENDGAPRFVLGVAPVPVTVEYDALLRYGPVDAIGAALHETWRYTTTTLGMIWRMVSGVASLKNVSGPITIAQVANISAQMGLAWFLSFLAVLSLSLCIMNLLPIPVLDGGHLMYYLIEMLKGSPVSERAMIVGQYLGIVLLMGLMGLAFYNDILRLVSS